MVCLVESRPVVWKVFNRRSVRCEWFGAVPHFLFSTRDSNISPIITQGSRTSSLHDVCGKPHLLPNSCYTSCCMGSAKRLFTEGCWVLNFEESWCHDLGGYEVLPLVTLMVQVFLGCDIMSFGKYSDSWKDHCVYEDQELLTQLHSATSVKTWIW